jgi:hypothetical protein
MSRSAIASLSHSTCSARQSFWAAGSLDSATHLVSATHCSSARHASFSWMHSLFAHARHSELSAGSFQRSIRSAGSDSGPG